MIRGLLLLLASTSISAVCLSQDIYKTVDANGNVSYSDKPTGSNSEKIEVQEPIVVPQVIPTPRTIKLSPPAAPQSYAVIMSYPTPELHINPGTFNLPIQVNTDPNVHPDHQLVILDNGEPVDGLVIEYIIRGTHVIQAEVRDEQGKVLGKSEPVNVYVHRPTINSRANIEARNKANNPPSK